MIKAVISRPVITGGALSSQPGIRGNLPRMPFSWAHPTGPSTDAKTERRMHYQQSAARLSPLTPRRPA